MTPRSTPPRRRAAPDAPLSIVMVSPEAQPFAKTGGLADVAGALPLALGRLGHTVTLVTPRYRGVPVASEPAGETTFVVGGRALAARGFRQEPGPGVRALLVDCPELFDRDGLYGIGSDDYADNPLRFALLARAALEWTAAAGGRPSVVHAHDWQGGLVPIYLRSRYAGDPVFRGVPSVFTIHNLGYQGLFDAGWLPALDLGREWFTVDALEFWGRASLLKGGINFSDRLTTVSPRYAHEILTPELGFGFEGILARRRRHLSGILNGIDIDAWNPADDPHLPVPFHAGDLTGKAAAKRELLATFRLPADGASLERPVIALISRLVDQKGFDLLAALGAELPALDAAYILLGTGEPRYQDFWLDLAARHPDRVAARIGFSEPLAHLIEAGADMFLMPSRFEPCGLNQMYSLRYGTVPVVRATGGLADTVRNYRERTGEGTGFTFTEYSSSALLKALGRALLVFRRKDEWRRIQQAGMAEDHSWDRSAREYVRVYRSAMRRPGREPAV